MNRVIIVGNGFDLAHGLKTKYSDFIDWYWDQWVNVLWNVTSNVASDPLCTFKANGTDPWSLHIYTLRRSFNQFSGRELLERVKSFPDSYSIQKSLLLERISNSIYELNWVDIENEYYKILKDYSKQRSDLGLIVQLNNQLNFIQNILIKYLRSANCVDHTPSVIIGHKMLSPFSENEIAVSRLYELRQYIIDGYHNQEAMKKRACRYQIPSDKFTLDNADFYIQYQDKDIESVALNLFPDIFKRPDRILLLNFNYTHVADMSLPVADEFEINHIHGDISFPKTVIFGYGDELDHEYSDILSRNENCYLDNIKSIRYLESSNYRRMLQFIESAPFQVYIMGHSCGNSDRTLLNTIFEHDNCVSVKPFYYVKEDGSDNYLELVQNISRNFTDMKKMRDRVVNKEFCEPLVK